MINAVSVAIAVGLIGGVCFGYFLSKALAFRLSRLSPSPRIVTACAGAGALLMLFPGFFLCFAVGGSLGGAWGEAASSSIGLGSVGTPFGLAAGIAAVLGGVLVLGTLLGGLLGKVLARLLPKSTLR